MELWQHGESNGDAKFNNPIPFDLPSEGRKPESTASQAHSSQPQVTTTTTAIPEVTLAANLPSLPSRQILSRDVWEELKPLIHKLYIEENMALSSVAKAIQESHGFLPTKRQFGTRLAKWGFKKNATKEERKKLLIGLDPQRELVGFNGQKVKKAKLARWEKEMRRESRTQHLGPRKSNPEDGESRTHERNSHPLSWQRSLSVANPESNHSNSIEVDDGGRSYKCEGISPSTTYAGLSPINSSPWSKVDVPGSPRLSRLFSTLSLEVDSDIDKLSISNVSTALTTTENKEYISGSELRRLSQSGNENHRFAVGLVSLPKAGQQAGYEFKFARTDVFFPSGDWISPSPYYEVYPFPPSVSTRTINTTPEDISIPALEMRVMKHNTTLHKLNALLPEEHPRMMESIEDLARAYHLMGKYALAEQTWRRFISLKARKYGAVSSEVLSASLQLLTAIDCMGPDRFEEAEQMNEQLKRYITSYHPGDDDLMAEALHLQATRLDNKSQPAKAENLRRQILQMCLSRLGPRDPRTIHNMSRLGSTIGLSQVYAKDVGERHRIGVHLTRTAVKLHIDIGASLKHEGRYLANRLLFLLRTSGEYDESVTLGEIMVERFKQALGEHHPTVYRYMAELGATYRAQGELEKSVATLQVAITDPSISEHNRDMAWRREELGQALEGIGRLEEAAILFQKMIDAFMVLVGPIHEDTSNGVKFLGDCYGKQNKHAAAKELYEQYITDVEAEEGDQSELIKEVRGWIEEISQFT